MPSLCRLRRALGAGLACGGLALGLCGCVVVPGGDLPGPGHVEPTSMAALTPGQTTRVDVLMMLGDPDQRRLDDRVFGYLWHELVAAILYGNQLAGEVDFTRRRLLLIEFDADGRLRRMDVVGGIRDRTLNEAVESWLAGVSNP